jgi:F-type H+-transporting ATPase subunit b
MRVRMHHGKGRSKGVFAIRVLVCLMLLAAAVAMPGTILASGGEHGAEAAAKGWESTDWYRVMNFAVLAVLLFLVVRKPAARALNGRIKTIASELDELESRKAGVEKQLAEYNNRLALLDHEAEQIIAEYIRQGEEAKARILKEAQASAEKLEEQAQKNIEHEFTQAKNVLQKAVMEKALAKAEEIIKTRISGEDQERLVDEYLNKVVV